MFNVDLATFPVNWHGVTTSINFLIEKCFGEPLFCEQGQLNSSLYQRKMSHLPRWRLKNKVLHSKPLAKTISYRTEKKNSCFSCQARNLLPRVTLPWQISRGKTMHWSPKVLYLITKNWLPKKKVMATILKMVRKLKKKTRNI